LRCDYDDILRFVSSSVMSQIDIVQEYIKDIPDQDIDRVHDLDEETREFILENIYDIDRYYVDHYHLMFQSYRYMELMTRVVERPNNIIRFYAAIGYAIKNGYHFVIEKLALRYLKQNDIIDPSDEELIDAIIEGAYAIRDTYFYILIGSSLDLYNGLSSNTSGYYPISPPYQSGDKYLKLLDLAGMYIPMQCDGCYKGSNGIISTSLAYYVIHELDLYHFYKEGGNILGKLEGIKKCIPSSCIFDSSNSWLLSDHTIEDTDHHEFKSLRLRFPFYNKYHRDKVIRNFNYGTQPIFFKPFPRYFGDLEETLILMISISDAIPLIGYGNATKSVPIAIEELESEFLDPVIGFRDLVTNPSSEDLVFLKQILGVKYPSLVAKINTYIINMEPNDLEWLTAFPKCKDMLIAMIELGLYCRGWQGDIESYPYSDRDSITTVLEAKIYDRVIHILDPANSILGRMLKTYDISFQRSKLNIFDDIIKQIAKGKICIRYASSYCCGTGIYYLHKLFNQSYPNLLIEKLQPINILSSAER